MSDPQRTLVMIINCSYEEHDSIAPLQWKQILGRKIITSQFRPKGSTENAEVSLQYSPGL